MGVNVQMKFFIPEAKDKQEEQAVYEGIKKTLVEDQNAQVDNRRIWKLEYTHDGNKYEAEVGEPHKLNSFTVIAILHAPANQQYYVYSLNGRIRRIICVGDHHARECIDFEPE